METGKLIAIDKIGEYLGRPKMPRITVYNMMTKGVNGIRLKGLKICNKWYFTEEDIIEFGRACGEAQIKKHDENKLKKGV